MPERGTHSWYKCPISSCTKPQKMWERKDNFKQHVQRMHKEVKDSQIEDIVKRYVL